MTIDVNNRGGFLTSCLFFTIFQTVATYKHIYIYIFMSVYVSLTCNLTKHIRYVIFSSTFKPNIYFKIKNLHNFGYGGINPKIFHTVYVVYMRVCEIYYVQWSRKYKLVYLVQ